ncbi:MAG: hypothetical protein PQJ59_14525 [Spirochaetales bacterium]|nr:hypothetical protein [Spirochaetales bacterium]
MYGLDEWEMYLEHGDEFYRCAKGGFDKPEKFNTDALFNLAAMAIEKMSMGFLMKNSMMPEGSGFQNLVNSMNEVSPLPSDLEEEIVGLDKFQASFCSLEIFRPDPVTRKDIPPMLDVCDRLQRYVKANLDLTA